jgi:uncharacterized protein YukE
MTQVKKQQLINLLQKEQLSFYDIKELVGFVAEAFTKCEEKGFHWLNGISAQVNDDIQEAVRSVSGLSAKLIELEDTITKQQAAAYEDVWKIWNDNYAKLKQQLAKAEQEVKVLPAIQFPEVKVPYNWKELLEMTDRLSQRTPEQRQVFYELVERYNAQPKQETV